MTQLSGRRVLVTGASGLVALPVSIKLARSNEVHAVARFSNPQQRMLEAAGAHTIAFDLAEHDLSALSMREGVRRVIEAGQTGRVTTHHVIGEPSR